MDPQNLPKTPDLRRHDWMSRETKSLENLCAALTASAIEFSISSFNVGKYTIRGWYKVGPLPVISMVITPLIGVITPVTQL